MATSVRPNQVAHQRVRDFNLLESRLRWPSTNLRRFVTFRTHPSQELSVEQPCTLPLQTARTTPLTVRRLCLGPRGPRAYLPRHDWWEKGRRSIDRPCRR